MATVRLPRLKEARTWARLTTAIPRRFASTSSMLSAGMAVETTSSAPSGRFAGSCPIAGSSPAALEVAAALARRLGMEPFEIPEHGRAAYHAAASIASNFLVTLEAAAERVAAGADLDPDEARALLAPLVRSTVENWVALGPGRALTGPVARGDEATVEAQRAAVAAAAPELLALFDELVAATRSLSGQGVVA
jgi:predicted short-subunit dehydrogenase-like oxidoreductase (DUF2520 family)